MSLSSAKGITLIELMIVIAVIFILGMIAYPTYTSYMQKSRRAEAKTILLDIQLAEERYRASNVRYAVTLGSLTLTTNPASNTFYTFTVASASTSGYTLQADGTGTSQSTDKASGTNCATLTLNQSAVQNPAACW